MSEFQLFDSVVCNFTFIRNVWNSKSSEFDPRGGGRKFSKSSEIQKVLNYPRGGGASLISNFSQIFQFFFSDGSPKKRTSGSKRCARSPIQSVRDEPNQFNMQRTTQSMIRGLFEFQDCPVSTVHSKSRMGGGLRNRGQWSELYDTILDFTGQY